MKRTSAELKRLARKALKDHYGLPMGAMIVTSLMISAIMMPFIIFYGLIPNAFTFVIFNLVSLVLGFLGVIFQSGIIYIHLGLARNKPVQFTNIFYAFTIRPDRFILANLLIMAVVIISMIPGIMVLFVAALTDSIFLILFSMFLMLLAAALILVLCLHVAIIFELLVDNPNMGLITALKECIRLMKGNKGRYFYINLSFVGWILLGVLSCYIGFLWIIPYILQTNVMFYLDVIGELDHLKEPDKIDSNLPEHENVILEQVIQISEDNENKVSLEKVEPIEIADNSHDEADKNHDVNELDESSLN